MMLTFLLVRRSLRKVIGWWVVDGHVALSVEVTGPVIAKADQERAYERFVADGSGGIRGSICLSCGRSWKRAASSSPSRTRQDSTPNSASSALVDLDSWAVAEGEGANPERPSCPAGVVQRRADVNKYRDAVLDRGPAVLLGNPRVDRPVDHTVSDHGDRKMSQGRRAIADVPTRLRSPW